MILCIVVYILRLYEISLFTSMYTEILTHTHTDTHTYTHTEKYRCCLGINQNIREPS